QEDLADAGQGRGEGIRRTEIAGRYLYLRRERCPVRVAGQCSHGLTARGERPDELAAHVSRCSGHQDHVRHSSVLTRVSPPVTSSTAQGPWGWATKKTAGGPMPSGGPIRRPGITSAPRRRRSARPASGRNDHMSLSV